MIYEDGTPMERAENFKRQGNNMVKRGEKFYEEAVVYYSQALDEDYEDDAFRSILYSNRAQVQLLQKHYNYCMQDCRRALDLDRMNVKAWYRLARAMNELGKHGKAASVLAEAIEDCPDDRLMREMERSGKLATELEDRRRRDREARERASTILTEALRIRNVATGPAFLDTSAYTDATRVDTDGTVHWSLLLVYPETGQTDFLADVPENAYLDDVTNTVLEASAEWDECHRFTPSSIFLAFLLDWTPVMARSKISSMGDDDIKAVIEKHRADGKVGAWRKAAGHATLGDVLSSSGYVVPGIPTLYVMRKKCDFTRKFIKKKDV